MSWPAVNLSRRSAGVGDQPISYFMEQAVENPGLITLAAGLVDPLSLPASEVRQALDELLAEPAAARAALQYGTTVGYAALRDKLLRRAAPLEGMAPGELALSAEDVVVTTGSQQLLYLLTEVLCDPGDIVLTEAPTYFVYLSVLESLGVRAVGVPMDENGLNLDALQECLARLERDGEIDRLRLIYVCDYFQNPSGRTLSLARRWPLLELVKRYSVSRKVYILEDAAYRELRYRGPDLPSLKSFDEGNQHVILAMSFSKTLSPSLKTGYGLLPRELVKPLAAIKSAHDFGGNNLAQHLIERLLDRGGFDRHLAAMCRLYREKLDLVLKCLTREFARWPQVRWTRPDGGLYVWLTFPEGVETGPGSALVEATVREGVLYVPGCFCYPSPCGASAREARLCFAPVPTEQIPEAMRRLGRAVASVL
jgi:2-aminoadipate transaminase